MLLTEKFSHSLGTYSNENFIKFWARGRNKWHPSFSWEQNDKIIVLTPISQEVIPMPSTCKFFFAKVKKKNIFNFILFWFNINFCPFTYWKKKLSFLTKFTPIWGVPATALANMVFPTPGGPSNRIPTTHNKFLNKDDNILLH